MLSNLYVKIGIYAAVMALGIGIGYWFESTQYAAYQNKVVAAGLRQGQQSLDTQRAWSNRMQEAQGIYAANIQWIIDHNKPVPRVLCFNSSASTLPENPSTANTSPTSTGVIPPETGGSFDPTDKLTALADEADQVVEACRVVINSWPK